VSTNVIVNKFEINYQTNGAIADTFSETNDLRNMTVNYTDYVIYINNTEYPVIGFTGSTNLTSDTLKFEVQGDPFTTTGSTTVRYHIKPKSTKVESFFNQLDGLQSYLLNRLTVPNYTADFRFTRETDDGQIVYVNKEVTWPVTDGYNIDFDTTEYVNYVGELLEIADSSDGTKTDLMTRFLTSESISDFDTIPKCDGDEEETAGQKMNKTLKIYGREYDEIKKYIDGIKFSNTVTYDKKDNTPDTVLKYLARVLGWELVSSVLENDLLKAYLTPADSSFSGHSRGYTPAEAEVELWRRIILNTPWIWKSKGTRKGVEFFFKFIGAPHGLISFNEYIYVAKEPLDVDLFLDILEENNLERDTDEYNIDTEGYPMVLPDTPDMYFQKGGLWWRETGGANSQIDILAGNNPHVGPYDAGKEYIHQFECLIPNFSAVTVVNETLATGTTNIFTNYNSGLVNNTLDQNTYTELVNKDNYPLGCFEATTNIIDDPKPSAELTDCGCDTPDEDEALQIYIRKTEPTTTTTTVISCEYRTFALEQDGFLRFLYNDGSEGYIIDRPCCEALNFEFVDGAKSCRWKTVTDTTSCDGWTPYQVSPTSTDILWQQDIDGIIETKTYVTEQCCLDNGYMAEANPNGEGYKCKVVQCNPNIVYSSPMDNPNDPNTEIAVWIDWDNDGVETTVVNSVECCDILTNATAVPVNGGYECHTVKSSTPDSNCLPCSGYDYYVIETSTQGEYRVGYYDVYGDLVAAGGGYTKVKEPSCCFENPVANGDTYVIRDEEGFGCIYRGDGIGGYDAPTTIPCDGVDTGLTVATELGERIIWNVNGVTQSTTQSFECCKAIPNTWALKTDDGFECYKNS
jgi:hypothetical protein